MKKAILLLLSILFARQIDAFPKTDGATVPSYPDVSILIDEPEVMKKGCRTEIILYALPNGNSIEWTAGKRLEEGDDWHFNIQHIAAQTAFLRAHDKSRNYVTVYLMAKQKAWSTWNRIHKDISTGTYEAIIEDIVARYKGYRPSITISSHSGGGYFIFNYIAGTAKINPAIKRLAFLDSVYGYETQTHFDKLKEWLRKPGHFLSVISYEDTTVIYNGKPLVSAEGGTWGRSHRMLEDFGTVFPFKEDINDTMEIYKALGGRFSIKLLRNPEGKIFHTVLVARNGFIDSFLTGTAREGRAYTFWGDWAYEEYIK